MEVVLDTNVFISGIYFAGLPSKILMAWRDERIRFAVTDSIIDEYVRVGNRLRSEFPRIDPTTFYKLLRMIYRVYPDVPLPGQVCRDSHDDKFIACALVSGCNFVVTGDRALLAATGYRGVAILKPRDFVERYLR